MAIWKAKFEINIKLNGVKKLYWVILKIKKPLPSGNGSK